MQGEFRTEYHCPAEDCSKAFQTENELRGHIAGMMQYDEAHEWENLPVSHSDLTEAEVEVPGRSF